MITVTLLLLLAAFILSVFSIFVSYDRVNLTAVAVLLVVIALLLGNVR